METFDLTDIDKKSFFKKIAYSTCWEDFKLVKKGLKLKEGDKLLSISSAGCNILNALLCKPKKVLAIDINPNQLHLLKLKIVAIKNLEHHQFIELLGVTPSEKRITIYKNIRKELNEETKKFWDKNVKLIEEGITYNGRQERYIKLLGKYVRFLKGEEKIKNLVTTPTVKEQLEYFNKNIKDFSWNLFYDLVYCKPVMIVVKDKLVFNQVKSDSYGKRFRERVEDFFRHVPVKNNPFSSLALLGYYLNENYYPEYLKQQNFNLLKENVDKIRIKKGSIQDILHGLNENCYNKFNLSNVLDWISKEKFKETLKELVRVGEKNARFCYFNTLMKRTIPRNISDIKSHKEKAKKLLQQDRAFLYENFEIGEIKKTTE